MLKKISALVLLPLLLGGCTANFTNLTPQQQIRNANNLYPVEVALNSRQQVMRWDSIKPQIVVNGEFYPMRPTPLMTNRWEGLVPVPPGTSSIQYQYKFDYLNNAFGGPQPNSAFSRNYNLRVLDSQ
ncbi:MAG TPA: hypothetical protein VK327_03770 [Candidatus Paceibacterota bacterium]|nr:hypothetical protein [Candidatus Paceibacterota bacterium]